MQQQSKQWNLLSKRIAADEPLSKTPADSPIRRLYLLALIDATKHPQIHGHPTTCQTAAQISPVLTKESIRQAESPMRGL